ncbi:hypothetical protein [Salidesulfovibrio onnuriiensis]|uniref:hypothetical protein n=1 Tax=Salidesulfovibrio onnuriiensis TaxID=2583823 RepID=UPI0011CC839A|nr:hypothetical protein [Salidesulfovibrio onnuriiensis]
MRKMMTVIVSAVLAVLLCGSAFAVETCESKGSAIVPHIQYRNQGAANNRFWDTINLSNISGSDVIVTVKLYDHAGGRVAGRFGVYKGSTTDTSINTVATGVETFALPAGETRMLTVFKDGEYFMGYGIIEWCSADEKLGKALTGTVRHYGLNGAAGTYSGEYVLNGGQPF